MGEKETDGWADKGRNRRKAPGLDYGQKETGEGFFKVFCRGISLDNHQYLPDVGYDRCRRDAGLAWVRHCCRHLLFREVLPLSLCQPHREGVWEICCYQPPVRAADRRWNVPCCRCSPASGKIFCTS